MQAQFTDLLVKVFLAGVFVGFILAFLAQVAGRQLAVAVPHDRLAALPHPERVSDGDQGAARMYAALDAAHTARENRRRFDYVVAHLTQSQHELFLLMAAGLSREQIALELKIEQPTLSERETCLIKKLKNLAKSRYAPPLFPPIVEAMVLIVWRVSRMANWFRPFYQLPTHQRPTPASSRQRVSHHGSSTAHPDGRNPLFAIPVSRPGFFRGMWTNEGTKK